MCNCQVCKTKRNPPTLDELRRESIPVTNINDAVFVQTEQPWWQNELPEMDTVYSGNRCYMTQEPSCLSIDPCEPGVMRDGRMLYVHCGLKRGHKSNKHISFTIGIPGCRVPRHEW